MQTLTLKVPADLADWLEKQARRLNCPKSEIVRESLRAQRDRKPGGSVTARAGDLVGKFASGRKESSHKRHLKDFGACRRS